jgi:hypothetical protein
MFKDRNSYSKPDSSATFMRIKKYAMNNDQTMLQLTDSNQKPVHYLLLLIPNSADTLTLMPFFSSFAERYNQLSGADVADFGYVSEENYQFMETLL